MKVVIVLGVVRWCIECGVGGVIVQDVEEGLFYYEREVGGMYVREIRRALYA